jgi:hypothetical protein
MVVMQVQLVLVAVVTLLAAFVGWRGARYRRKSFYDEQPLGMSNEAYARREHRRHMVRRVTTTVLYGLAGAAASYGISLALHLH